MESVVIKGQSYNLHKNLQDFVKYTIQKLLETNSLTNEDLQNLQMKEYCKEKFNLNFPLLSKDRFAYAEDKKHPRYYAESGFFVQGYYLCNHWFEDNEEFFSKWLMEISK